MKLKLSKKDIKANRGITLIALVITIICTSNPCGSNNYDIDWR